MSQVECAHCGETGLSLSARCPACEQRVCLRCRKASTPTDCNSWHVANEDGGPPDSGSGSEPPANPSGSVHISRLCSTGEHGWCANRGPDETRCKCPCHQSGSPPVGPLQVLREAIKRERYAGWPEDVVPARRRIDEALESVEEQVAALQRENARLLKLVDDFQLRAERSERSLARGSFPSSPTGDA